MTGSRVAPTVLDELSISGYPSLAKFIASDRDQSTFLFRRFDKLSARNLLYLQTELAELEERQATLDKDDFEKDLEGKAPARNWELLRKKADDAACVDEKERFKLVLEIRDKLKTYKEAILLDSTLLALRKPSERTYEAFEKIFNHAGTNGTRFPILGDASAHAYDDRHDLLSLCSLEDDQLTRILRDHLPVFFMSDSKDQRSRSPLAYVSEHRIQFLGGAITVVMAAVLLFGAIFSLYYTVSDERKLGLIAGYTSAFALAVRFLTNARRAEVFGACAAYAAVLVVFISGSLSPPGTSTTKNQDSQNTARAPSYTQTSEAAAP